MVNSDFYPDQEKQRTNLSDFQKEDSPKAVIATILELLHSSAVVQLPNLKKAILPWDQVWPKYKIHDKYKDYKIFEDKYEGKNVVKAYQEGNEQYSETLREISINDRILVIEYDTEFGGTNRRIVSHSRACNNPWDNVATWNDSDVKSFIVEGMPLRR